MKIRFTITLIVLVVLTSVIAGCNPIKGDDLVKVMRIAPENTRSIVYIDLETMKEDPDLEDRYGDMRDDLINEIEDIHVSDIHSYAMINLGAASLYIQIGKLDAEEIHDNLKEKGYIEGKYRGVEIWTDGSHVRAMAFTLIGNMVIYGDKDTVEACLRVHKNEEPSMYDNEDTKLLLDKLSIGIFNIIVNKMSGQYIIDNGLLAGGVSISNLTSGDEVLDIKGWFKFDSEANAEAALADVKDFVEALLFGADVNMDGQLKANFVEITGVMYIGDFH